MNITVVGAGYVGLVTGAGLASLGHRVACVDVRAEVVDAINGGRAPFFEPDLPALIQAGLAAGLLRATTDLMAAVSASDVSMIAVGTPSTAAGIDLSAVRAAAEQIGDALRGQSGYHVVVVKSTVVPGTTDTLVLDAVARRSGRRAGDFGVCANPEFLREGSAVADFLHPDRIVIGEWDERSGAAVAALYEKLDCPIVRTTCRNAELTKYASNALLALLVSFSNELAAICEALPGTDVDDVLDALHLDRRLSPLVEGRRITPAILAYLRSGAGFGGSCLPKDVTALRRFTAGLGLDTALLDAIVAVNERRPRDIAGLIEDAVEGLTERTIAVLGLAFKPGTDDLRDSPALALVERLEAGGGLVRVYDPQVTAAPSAPWTGRGVACATPEDALREADAAVIATAWPEFRAWNWDALCRTMRTPVIVDGRNVLRGVALPAGVRYWPVGRRSGPPATMRGAPHIAQS
jgi:UDPglucose 6-dehydrogenase/GDP-mannose 6-dehydrogenase